MQKDLAFGQSVERLAEAKVLPKLFTYSETKPVGNNPFWRRHGVDFVVQNNLYKESLLVEVKGDRQDTGNIVIETHTVRNEGTEELGWLYTSKADFILYFILQRHKYIILELAKLRRLLAENHHTLKVKSTFNPWGTTFFYVLKVSWIEQHFVSHALPEGEFKRWLTEFGVTY